MANTDRNLDDLTNAARLKLQAQKRQQEKENGDTQPSNGDIYADFMQEDNYPTLEQIQPNEISQQEYLELPKTEDDFQIYENGPYFSQVEIWKKQYGEGHILHVQVINKHFIFRTINRFEYKQLVAMDNIDALMREEIICNTCVLHPRNMNFKSMASEEAGYPSTLAKIIMENSGFTSEYGIEVL